jgi:hypothetical protein
MPILQPSTEQPIRVERLCQPFVRLELHKLVVLLRRLGLTAMRVLEMGRPERSSGALPIRLCWTRSGLVDLLVVGFPVGVGGGSVPAVTALRSPAGAELVSGRGSTTTSVFVGVGGTRGSEIGVLGLMMGLLVGGGLAIGRGLTLLRVGLLLLLLLRIVGRELPLRRGLALLVLVLGMARVEILGRMELLLIARLRWKRSTTDGRRSRGGLRLRLRGRL